MIFEYVCLVEKVRGGYTAFFPDISGLGSSGTSIEATRKNAKKGLIAHIELMIESGGAIPKPRVIDNIMKLTEARGCIPLIISIVAPTGKAQRINITMDRALINALDEAAQSQHKSRSALLSEAAQRLLSDL